ncbi:related to DNA repair protein rhp55 [Phialocephala subalpina]|uniref:Related to DNA repair protein rhp55 n=1 Tax=Phialocephala subalpina TaxID=576137 RepID=A0A1L7XBY3_9HELO|nr:related to DNA repair protein rhp55 [Phialocephala subalpina]
MDYNSIHGPGISNFSSSSPHRMPTVSAAQALQDLKSSPTRCVSTGLPLLNCALQSREPVTSDAEPFYGGVSRGKLTEIYGPPGVGKTALGMQLTDSALRAGEGVVWVDASHPVSGRRLAQILASSTSSSPPPAGEELKSVHSLLEKLTHFSTPTLAHFIALFSQPTDTHPPTNTSLVIIDSFSTLIACAFPKNADSNTTPRKPGASNPSARKFDILKYITSTLQKLAATRNIAIVIMSQCVTKMRSGAGAGLVPSINITAWEQGLGCRLTLFRDWGWDDEDGKAIHNVRLAQVIKAEGVLIPENKPRIIAFSILTSGLVPVTPPTLPTNLIPTSTFVSPTKRSPHPLSHSHTHPDPVASQTLPILPTPSTKRKLTDTDFEIPDSDEDDEDYDWAEEDEEELPPPPPQWQGSEDVLGPGAEEDAEFEKDEELDELAGDTGDPRDSMERINNLGVDHGPARFDGDFASLPTAEPEDGGRPGGNGLRPAASLMIANSDSEDELA